MTAIATLSTTTNHTARMKGVGAVLAGIVATAAATTLTDVVLHASAVFPPWGEAMAGSLYGLALAYRTGFGIGGGYVTARLAPNRPSAHVVILGIVGTLLSIAGAVATWNGGVAYGPKWYALALVATALPSVWVGGRLARR